MRYEAYLLSARPRKRGPSTRGEPECARNASRGHGTTRQEPPPGKGAEHVEALVLMLAAGGECLDDMALLGADRGLLELLQKPSWPSADAARQFLLGFHDEKLMEKGRAAMAPTGSSLVPPESAPLEGLMCQRGSDRSTWCGVPYEERADVTVHWTEV